jgi:hypothetical protein
MGGQRSMSRQADGRQTGIAYPTPFARRAAIAEHEEVDQKEKGLFLSGPAPRLVDGNILYRLAGCGKTSILHSESIYR